MKLERFVTEYEKQPRPYGYRYHCGLKTNVNGKQYGVFFYTNKPPGKKEWRIAEEDLRFYAQTHGLL